MLAWCRSNHIAVRGHCLFWEPERWQPKWVPGLGTNELRVAVERRMASALTHFDVADTNEQSNADKLELVYRTAFSHPAVAGIMTWVVWAGSSWRGPNAGLVRKDWSLNAAGVRFERLMQEWSTQAVGVTDGAGRFGFRGFHGDYEITLTAPGRLPLIGQWTLATGTATREATFKIGPDSPR
jgi:GH35 family endo-1,4-beta-xylanase